MTEMSYEQYCSETHLTPASKWTESRGDVIRLADTNFNPGAGTIDHGLYAVPVLVDGMRTFFLVDGGGNVLHKTMGSSLNDLAGFIVAKYNSSVHLTEVARALL